MELKQEEYEFAQLILKYYSPKIIQKEKISLSQSNEQDDSQQDNSKMDTKTKYSLDYEKFENYMLNADKSKPKTKEEIEMDKMIESNPYLSQIACTHDRRKERELYDKPTKEKLENAEYFKNEGNIAFRNNEYDKASYLYQKALLHFDYTFPDTEEENKKYNLLLEQCNNNLAQCKFTQEKYDEAWNYSHQVLKLNPNNQKALYRQARIALMRDQYSQCLELIEKLKQDDKDTINLYKLLAERQTKYQQKQVEVCQKMFQQ